MSGLKVSLSINAVSNALKPLKRTQQSLKKMQSLSGDISSYNKQRRAFLQNAQAMHKQQRALNDAKQALRTAKRPTQQLRNKVIAANVAFANSRARVIKEKHALKELKGSLQKAGIATHNLSQSQRRLDAKITKTTAKLNAMKRTRAGIKTLGRTVGKVGIAFGWVGFAMTGLRKVGHLAVAAVAPFVKMSTQLEDIKARITALSHGNREAGRSAMKWLSVYTDKNPARSITEMADAFILLKQYGMDAKKVLPKLNDYNVGIGGDQQNLKSMIDNLNQIKLSGRFSGRALARLSRNGIDAAQLLSDYSKKHMKQSLSPDEIRQLAKDNKLGSDAIDALIHQMGEEQKGAAKKKPTEWNEMIESIKGSWEKFKKGVMDSGPFRMMKGYLSDFANHLRQLESNGTLKRWATTTGHVVVGAFKIIRAAFKITMVVAKALLASIKVLVSPFVLVYKVAYKLGEVINDLINKFDKLTGSGLGKLIGKSVAFVAAGLGNKEAQQALDNDARAQGHKTLIEQQQQRQSSHTEKNNTHITVDVNDKRVDVNTQHDGPATVDTHTGANLAGAL